ncbi:replicase [polyscias citrivirus 1]|uniref:Replicase n=1 Tax=polyscias citrivirus 1 TaxID=2945986 RepID=A0AAE9LUF8_9VIRU|nr:replicase [polyscias citrivirus 1]
MALTSNKTAIESILGNFEKKHVDAIYNSAAQTLISHSEFRNKHFAYALDSFKKKKCSELGIELYPNGYMPHSHPFSKILENHLLFDVLPGILSNDPVLFVSIKQSKLNVISSIKNNGDNYTSINRMVDGKDFGRYPSDSESFRCLSIEDRTFSKNFIRKIQGRKTVFFHDEIHHWTKKQMFKFLKDTNVQRLIFTIVYPPELLKRFANSQNPKLYDYRIVKGKLFFFPDGVKTEAYEQQLNLEWLFAASHLHSGEHKWTVTRHKSCFSHHLFEITKGDYCSPSSIFFSDYSSIDMSVIFLNRFRCYDVFPISLQHMYKVYSYLLCLKKPDLESGLAKLRQIIGDDVEIKEFLFFEQMCKRLIERQTSWSLFGYSFFEKLTDIALSKLPNSIARMFPSWKKKNTFEFLFSLGTLNIQIDRRVVFEHVIEEWGFEVVITDEKAYIDPLEVFGLNENFNEERIDDGFLERIKLPFWNLTDHKRRPSKKNAYDVLSGQLHQKPTLYGPEQMLRICWYATICEPDHDKPRSLFEMLGGLSSSPESDQLALEEILKEAVMHGLQFNSAAFASSITVKSFDIAVESVEKKEENSGKRKEREEREATVECAAPLNEFHFDLSECVEEQSEHGSEKDLEREDEKDEIVGEKEEKREKKIKKRIEIDYRRIYEKFNCMSTHDEFDVPADGNCFFHAILECVQIDMDHIELRAGLCHFLEAEGFDPLNLSQPGVYMEAEWIYLFCIWREMSIIMHEGDNVFIINSGFQQIHIKKEDEHFSALLPYNIITDVDPKLKDCNFNYSDELLKFKIKEDDYNCFKWRGRRSAFLTKVDADYGHNNMIYPYNGWNDTMEKIIELCDPDGDYNCALINFYDAGASLGYHRDNERVYNDDPILTVSLKGVAEFSFEFKEQTLDYCVTPGVFFVMPKGFQKKARHAVKCETERVSITFRKHVRRMNGSKISFDNEAKNLCLLHALANGLKKDLSRVIDTLKGRDKAYWTKFLKESNGGTETDCEYAAQCLGIAIDLITHDKVKRFEYGGKEICIKLEEGHFSIANLGHLMERTSVSHLVKQSASKVLIGLEDMLKQQKGFNKMLFESNPDYCRILVNSFLNMTTGICCGKFLDNGEKIFELAVKKPSPVMFDVIAISGFAGSGKSRRLQNWLKERKKGDFCVVSPRNNLMNDWQIKLELEVNEMSKVSTFEKFLKKDKSKLDLIVLDEFSLFPNGYLDLLTQELMVINEGCVIILLFDPLQARYHNKTDEHILTFDHDLDRLIDGQKINYMYGSFRMSKWFNRFFDLPCLNDLEFDNNKLWILDDVHSIGPLCDSRGEPCDVLLVESDLEKKAYCSLLRTMTFGESQGLTFDHVCILLSESSASSNEFRWVVGLTRAKRRMSFCHSFLGGLEEFKIRKKGGLIVDILNEKKIERSTFKKMIKCDLILQDLEVGCTDEIDREERLAGDPFLKPYIFLGQRIQERDEEVQEPTYPEPTCQTHLYITEPNFGLCYNFDFIKLKEEREYREDMLATNQFCDSYDKMHINGKRDTAGPLRFKAIYPKHSADDNMTFWMAVKKRLVFREEEENYQRFEKSHLIGNLLYQNFKKKMNLSFSFDQGLFEESVNAFEKKKLEKSCATIASHSIRSDIDWALNDVFLFMKSQLCTKYEKQFVDAKAGQTLACFQHLILVQFAPWCRYLESQIRAQLPEEIYIHSNKNFDDLNDWVKKFFQRDICVESDYEAFDASQDEYILSFEVHLMKDAHFPQEVIDAYVDLKCKLGCKLGHFSIMRFTGEFCTFLFNTLANIAFTMCRYEWRRGQPIAFAGDDMCALNNLSLCHDFDQLFEKISLKAKVARTETPMFCGWRLTPYGIVKEPELVYNRFQVAIEEGKVLECLENYAIEVSYAYSLGERLYEVLKSERQIQYHQAVVRFVVTHIDKLKTKVRDLFIEQSSDEDI